MLEQWVTDIGVPIAVMVYLFYERAQKMSKVLEALNALVVLEKEAKKDLSTHRKEVISLLSKRDP